MRDKRTTAEQAVASIADGMTVGIGGWGARRKPMTLVQALCDGPARDLTVVSFGGPDVGMLCRAGKVRKVVYGFVSLDTIPLEPFFRAAREAGLLETMELDEGMLQWGLRAAAYRLPFLPARAGLGSDVMTWNPGLKTIRSPYQDGEELVAVPALPLDVALVHVNRADARGNGQLLGPDPYFDDLFLMAARTRVLSCERIVDSFADAPLATLAVNRMMVDAGVEAPRGAGFTSCEPDYGRDDEALRAYARGAT
jgi:glutaconate CoA-transferase, subunit A